MTRTRLAVLCAAVALSGLAAPADAGHETGECRLFAIEALGSQYRDGLLDAVVTSAPADPVHVICSVVVNGAAVAYGSASGVGGAVVVERVSFAAADTDVVQVCTEIKTSHGTNAWCDLPDQLPGGAGERANSPVVGYISITHTGATGGPSYTLTGALADPVSWSCSGSSTASGYSVSCVPQQSLLFTWRCDVLHADVQTLAPGAVARTSMDCDGGGPEAATATVSGAGGFNSVLATSTVPVTAFTCTVDNGGGSAAVGDYRAGCGDPGVPYVE